MSLPFRPAVLLLLAIGIVAGCERPSERVGHERDMVGRALRGALAYPGSAVVGYGAGDEAAELVLTTSASPDTVTAWYRETLRAGGWTLRHESRARDGMITLYAERETRPLWIRLSPWGPEGTTYSLLGVEVRGDTIK